MSGIHRHEVGLAGPEEPAWTSSFSDEQRLLRDTLRAFVDEEILPVAREWEASGRYPTEIVDTMKEMGLFGMTVPEEYGGLDLDMVSFALVFEEIAARLDGHRRHPRQPLAGLLDDRACTARAEQKARYLPDARHRRAPHRHRR